MRTLLSILAAIVMLAPLGYTQTGIQNPAAQLQRTLPITATDIEILDTVLELSDAQRQLIDELFRDFQERYQSEIRERELKINELVDEGQLMQDADLLGEAQQIWFDWMTERKQLERVFLDDLRLILDESQIGLWPIVEREIRRKNEIGRGRMAGERVDMIRFVHEHIPDWQANEQLAAELRRYAERIDPPLRRRAELLDTELAQQWMMKRMEHTEECIDLYRQILAQRQRIRDLNLATLTRIKAALPEDIARDLEERFIQREVERARDWGTVHERIIAAGNLPSLTPEQRQQIEPIIRAYLERRPALLRRVFDEIRAVQDTHLPNKLTQALEGKGEQTTIGEGADAITVFAHWEVERIESLDEAYKARADHEYGTWKSIRTILTPEQRLTLPRPTDKILWSRDIREHGM